MTDDRKRINSVKEITTVRSSGFARYVFPLTNGYYLSIVTGSHFNSAEMGTIEVALMTDNGPAFGEDNWDESIIHYIYPEDAETLIKFYQMVINYPECFKHWGNIDDVYKDMFIAYRQRGLGIK